MSDQDITSEGDSTRQVSLQLENGIQIISGRSNRASNSGAQNNRSWNMIESTISCFGIVRKGLSIFLQSIAFPIKIYEPRGPLANSIFLMLCMASVLTEPLFLYTPVINDDKKCFKLENVLRIFASSYRWVTDIIYAIYAIVQFITNSHQNGRIRPFIFFHIDIFTILPLPQVLVILLRRHRIRGTKFLYAMKFFLLQHLLRVIRLYILFTKANTTGNLAGWAKVVFNLSYFHACHVIGALWYFLAVERQTVCWRKACINNNGCDNLSFYCDGSSGNYTFSNDFCSTSTKTQNTTAYDFGIFRDAIQSGVVGKANIIQRIVASLRWGLQNLSSFGQGLPFSANILENIFAMSITISSVVVLFFLIGKVQIYVQSETVKSEEIRHKVWAINRWRPFGKLPDELQEQVKRHQSSNWRETRAVDVEYLVNNLPNYLRREIKRQLCICMLKEVEEFGGRSDAWLQDLCHRVKPVFYRERSYIVQQGEPIDQMIFVLQGKLWSYTSSSSSRSSGSSSNYRSKKNDHLEDGDLCGKELVAWANANPDSSNLPISTRTIQALTNVEAFALIADDLKHLIVESSC